MYVHACKIWYFIGNLIHLIPSIVSDGIVELIEGLQSSRAKSKSLSPWPHDHIPSHISKCLVGYHLLEKRHIYICKVWLQQGTPGSVHSLHLSG